MSEIGLKVGVACLSGAYLAVNLASLYWLTSQQKARMQEAKKEAERDPFYDKYQEVIDLTCLTNLDTENAQKALLDDRFKNPISEKIMEVLAQTNDPGWQKVYLSRKTHKASYDDLMMIQASLKEKKMPYLTIMRRNPVRTKTGNGLLPDFTPPPKEGYVCDFRGHVHKDLKRHWQSQLCSVPVQSKQKERA